MSLVLRLRALLLLTLALAGCGASESGPWLDFAGGGFVVDYSMGAAYYGLVVKPLRHLPQGAVIEARFQDPAGGPDLVVAQSIDKQQLRYPFKSPSISGLRKGHAYKVEIRLLASQGGEVLGSYSRDFKSDVDQAAVAQ